MKVLLTAGGRGTRIPEITGSMLPKSLCRIIDRPFVNYQLEQLRKFGIRDIFVSLDEDWQVQLFKQSIRIREFPPLNYIFGIRRWGHPLNTFQDRDVLDFIGKDDFLWTYGDLLYDITLLKDLYKTAKRNQTSVGCKMLGATVRSLPNGKFASYTFDALGKLTGYYYSKRPNFTIHGPFWFKNVVFRSIKEEVATGAPRTGRLLLRLIDAGALSLIQPKFLISMNTSKDLERTKRALKRWRLRRAANS